MLQLNTNDTPMDMHYLMNYLGNDNESVASIPINEIVGNFFFKQKLIYH